LLEGAADLIQSCAQIIRKGARRVRRNNKTVATLKERDP
jgi:hypothetical protein